MLGSSTGCSLLTSLFIIGDDPNGWKVDGSVTTFLVIGDDSNGWKVAEDDVALCVLVEI